MCDCLSFLFIATLVGVKCCLNVILIYIFSVTKSVEYLFQCLLTIHVSSLEKMSIQILCLFKISCLLIIVVEEVYIQCVWLANIFFHLWVLFPFY